MGVEFENLDDIMERFENLTNKQALESSMGRACALVEGAAKEKAPRDSGALRRSIESRVESTDSEVKGIISSPLEYAPYVEFGTGLFAEKGGRRDVPWKYEDDNGNYYYTKGMHPQPYLRPALHENREEIARILKEGITE